jgi:glycosyltransferase involved in cell wall biosynthesis
MIEAMACGAPVLAFKGGSVPEIVENGLTGAIVETVEEAIAALPLVIALDRKKIRQRFVQRFSATRMAKDYFDLYRSLLNSARSLAGEDRDTRHRSPGSKNGIFSRLHAV